MRKGFIEREEHHREQFQRTQVAPGTRAAARAAGCRATRTPCLERLLDLALHAQVELFRIRIGRRRRDDDEPLRLRRLRHPRERQHADRGRPDGTRARWPALLEGRAEAAEGDVTGQSLELRSPSCRIARCGWRDGSVPGPGGVAKWRTLARSLVHPADCRARIPRRDRWLPRAARSSVRSRLVIGHERPVSCRPHSSGLCRGHELNERRQPAPG